ncbi:uncharacterized protein DNG_02729 [Cephalotrichum gorgonifer]|uniref:ATP synthase subunit K, mitochondrial n=1 Tax=Cephalotrichum gorgonifer TaxID=2041049 RepID=A0AAE8STC0_9PEZI|nr:uncharacterized protein DNG_02729 [Cephalotrichum gorgonifer]
MVQMYTILGRQVGSHYLAMGTLSALFGGSFLALSGGSKPALPATPPINASSSDEENFVKKFLEEQDSGKKGAAKH